MVNAMMIARRFFVICLVTAGFGAGLSIVVVENARPRAEYQLGSGSYLPCITPIQSNLCLGPAR